MGDNAKKELKHYVKQMTDLLLRNKIYYSEESGEILGTRQSGFHIFKMANLNEDNDLLDMANKNAKEIVRK